MTMSNKAQDYCFSISEDPELGAVAFIRPKIGEPYDQHCIMNFFVESQEALGFYEECEAMYVYSPDGENAADAETLKAKLLELGLEYDPSFGDLGDGDLSDDYE